ncbi:hypothetical protein [Pseudoalteromonas prydzensis]|uniref:hypothetical protein n=1 Tax=Pseudoalteromonas prydzensis TaxID=182141 RepID=UPI000ADAA148|nr:hypothetical protein [Pseudoalteromonas prydzensis]MBE0377920.1 hypothetical protein [Pseudoalteromonas prydzensis ACAM 620]
MQTVLKREEIDFIFDLYHPVECDENTADDSEPETEKLDTAQSGAIYKTSYLT